MNECWRVLVSDGRMFISVPAVDSDHAIIDPTHIRFFNKESFNFFFFPEPGAQLAGISGYWKSISFNRHLGELQFCIEKNPKPIKEILEEYNKKREKGLRRT